MSKKTPAQLQAEYRVELTLQGLEQALHDILKRSTHENATTFIKFVKVASPYLDDDSIEDLVKGEMKHAVQIQRSKRLRP